MKEPCPSEEEREAEKTQTAAKIGNIICVGLQDGRSVISTCSVPPSLDTNLVRPYLDNFRGVLPLAYHCNVSCCLPSIHVYSSVDTAVQCLLTLVNADSSPVLCLKYSLAFLFAGLANGKVAVYHRRTGGEISLQNFRVKTLVNIHSITLQ